MPQVTKASAPQLSVAVPCPPREPRKTLMNDAIVAGAAALGGRNNKELFVQMQFKDLP